MGATRLSRTDHLADPFEIADVEGVGSLVEPVLAQRLRELVGEREARGRACHGGGGDIACRGLVGQLARGQLGGSWSAKPASVARRQHLHGNEGAAVMWRQLGLLGLGVSMAACGTGQRPVTTTTMPTTAGQQVVIAEPAGALRGQVRHQVVGRIADIERNNGEVTVRSGDGAKLKLVLPPLAVANMREGDDVSIDVLVTPRR